MFWLLYLVVQPRDYGVPVGADGRLNTLFGWRAPAIDPRDVIERNRLGLVFAGWLVVGFVAGRLRPKLWHGIGICVAAPTLILYFATAPHDAEGYWVLDVIFLPIAGGVAAGVAKAARRVDVAVTNPFLFPAGVGILFAIALLAGGGESNGVIAGVGIGAALIAGTLRFAAPPLN